MSDINTNIALEEVLALCLNDLKAFCGVLFPDIFTAEFSILHDPATGQEIVESTDGLLEQPSNYTTITRR